MELSGIPYSFLLNLSDYYYTKVINLPMIHLRTTE